MRRCLPLFLLILGGACGGALGLVGLFGCLTLARDTNKPLALRVERNRPVEA